MIFMHFPSANMGASRSNKKILFSLLKLSITNKQICSAAVANVCFQSAPECTLPYITCYVVNFSTTNIKRVDGEK